MRRNVRAAFGYPLILLAPCAVLALAGSRGEGPFLARFAVSLVVPTAAAMLLSQMTILFPGLAAGGTANPWLAITLPVAYAGLTAAVAAILMNQGNPLLQPPAELAGAAMWLRPSVLAYAAGSQAILIRGAALLWPSR